MNFNNFLKAGGVMVFILLVYFGGQMMFGGDADTNISINGDNIEVSTNIPLDCVLTNYPDTMYLDSSAAIRGVLSNDSISVDALIDSVEKAVLERVRMDEERLKDAKRISYGLNDGYRATFIQYQSPAPQIQPSRKCLSQRDTLGNKAYNNPANIKYYKANNWKGRQVGFTGKFERFEKVHYCIRALIRILNNYDAQGYNTPSKIVHRYASGTDEYIDHICLRTGTLPGTRLDLSDMDLFYTLCSSICEYESGYIVNRMLFDLAYADAKKEY